jgi:hypothetical protein
VSIEAAKLSVMVESNALKVSGEVKALGQSVDHMAKTGKDSVKGLENQFASFSKGIQDSLSKPVGYDFGNVRKDMDAWSTTLKGASQRNQDFANTFATITDRYKSGSLSAEEARSKIDALKKSYDDAAPAAEKLGKAVKGMGLVIGGSAGIAYGIRAAFDQLMEYGKAGAAVNQTAESFDGLIDRLNVTPNLLDKLRVASKGTVDDMTLMSATAKLLAGAQGELASALAASTPQLMEIAKAASKLNPSLGDTATMYESLAMGIKRASPEVLDNLGLIVKIGAANEEYARILGKSVDALTAEEEKIALLNATIKAGNVLIEQAGGTTDAGADSIMRMDAATKNLWDTFVAKLAPGIGGVAETLVDVNRATEDSGTRWMQYIPVLNGVQAGFSGVKAAVDKLNGAQDQGTDTAEDWNDAQREAMHAANASTDGIRGAVRAIRPYVDLNRDLVVSLRDEGAAAENAALMHQRVALEIQNQTDIAGNLQGAYDDLATAAQNWATNAGGQAAGMLNENALGAEKYLLGLGAVDEVMGTNLKTAEEQERAMEAANKQYQATGDLEAYKTKLTEIKDTYLPLDEAVLKSTDLVRTFSEMWQGLESKYLTLRINYDGPGLGGVGANGTGGGSDIGAQERNTGTDLNGNGVIGRASGGPVYRNQAYWTGEQGPEPFFPAVDGRILSVEQAQAALAMGAGGQNQQPSGPVIIHKGAIVISGAGNPDVVADLVIKKLRRSN